MTKQTEALKLIQEHIDMQQYQHAWDKCQELIEQPAQEPYDLVAILNDPMQAYPANFTTAKKGNALLFGLCQEAADEIQRLQHKTLEQPAQEPVAWCDSLVSPKTFATNIQQRCPIPLYTHPAPSWQGLNDDELIAIIFKYVEQKRTEFQPACGECSCG